MIVSISLFKEIIVDGSNIKKCSVSGSIVYLGKDADGFQYSTERIKDADAEVESAFVVSGDIVKVLGA